MTLARAYARAGSDPALIAAVAAYLKQSWDPAGEYVAPDGERGAVSHAVTILGILATGGDTARVKGYLRQTELATFGHTRTTSETRGTIAETIWRWMVDAATHHVRHDERDD